MKVRPIFLILLAATILGAAYYSYIYVPRHSRPGQPVFVLPNYVLTYSPIQPTGASAYVLPDSLQVWDSPAMVRNVIATLKAGDRVDALGRFREWTRVRLADGRVGWVETDGLLDAATYEADERLLEELSAVPPQAAGHAVNTANVHIAPSRDSTIVARLTANQRLTIYGRRLVESPRPANLTDDLPLPPPTRDAWYLVRVGSRAGWVLGRLVDLDIPPAIASYAQAVNLVAWFVLDTVEDNGRSVPQYLVADRVGDEEYDFTHIRVLTWWKRKQTYAVAYVEGGLRGYFPILVTHQGSVPYFRLRLVDDQGAKFQKVYGLFDTVTRVMGTVDGWESDAMPEPGRGERHAARKVARHAARLRPALR